MASYQETKKTEKNKEEDVWSLNELSENMDSEGEETTDEQTRTGASTGRLPRSISVMNNVGEVVEESLNNEIKKFKDIIEEYLSKVSGTPAAIFRKLKKQLNAWKDCEVNIGVIGASGTGKSTLINNLRELRPGQPGAAEVGVVQTTLEPTSYSYPKNPSLKLWDIPGVGTQEFPKRKYLKLINFEVYDFFIIVCNFRFTEYDHWFACKVRSAGKKFYLVRTKFDIDLRNEQEDHPDKFNEENVFAKIREDCTKYLKKEVFGDFFVALVGKNPRSLEFPKLEERLILDRDNFKRLAMLYTLRTSTEEVIQEKTKHLLRRAELISIAAMAVAVLPVASPLASAGLIYGELKFYKKVLGLDDVRLKQVTEHAKVTRDEFICVVGQHFWLDLTLKKVISEMSNFMRGSPRENFLFKDIVSVYAFAHSGIATPKFLKTCINNMQPVATTILSKFFSKNECT